MILRVNLLIILLSFGCVEINAQAKSERTVEAQLRKMYSDDDGEVRYFLKWFDLNGDGIPEALVHVRGPQVCGTSGCDTHIFWKRSGNYELISTIGLSRPLVIAALGRSHGWRNLIVFVAGGGVLPGYYAELRFNGKTYPDNPTVAPAKPLKGRPHGIVLIKNFKGYIGSKRLNLSARTDTDKTPLDSNQSATIIAVFYKPGS
jgi:hypothetical protein